MKIKYHNNQSFREVTKGNIQPVKKQKKSITDK